MSPELYELLMAAGAIVAGATGYLVHRHRKNGNGKQAVPDVTVRPPGNETTGSADDTSRLAAIVKDAEPEKIEDLIRVMRESVAQKPATQGDVKKAIEDWGSRVRADINGHFRTTDAAIGDLRNRFNGLPCQHGDDDCDIIEVPVRQ